jgi:calpain
MDAAKSHHFKKLLKIVSICPTFKPLTFFKEANPSAIFKHDGFSRLDLDQGHLGNCWFIAACVDILQSPQLFSKVVPENQSFEEDYAGIFHFRFWLYGKWVDVVVDDRLPYWPNGQLVFCSNKKHPNEYWAPLLVFQNWLF